MSIRAEYADVIENTATGLNQPLDWSNDVLKNAEGYKLPTSMSPAAITSLIASVISSITSGETTGYECQMVVLAVAFLRRAGRIEGHISDIARDLGTDNLPWKVTQAAVLQADGGLSIKDRDARIRIIEAQKRNSTVWDALATGEQAALEQELKDLKAEASSALMDDPNQKTPLPPQTSSTELERTYHLFMISFLSKILAKAPENIEKAWKQAHERFSNFYMCPKVPIMKAPSKAWLDSLKAQFGLDRKAAKTILKLVVNYEALYQQADTPDAGLIRYLFSLPLSYAGMHAYKLFCAVKEKTKKANGWILSQLAHPLNNDGLRQIKIIINNFELNPQRSNTSFRYARLVGPQYFAPLQTKACPGLVWCLIQILNFYQSPGDSYNPENIVGVKGLSPTIKNKMKIAAKIIFNASPLDDKANYSGIMAQAFTTHEKPPVQTMVSVSDLMGP
jgi:hypothetical protein